MGKVRLKIDPSAGALHHDRLIRTVEVTVTPKGVADIATVYNFHIHTLKLLLRCLSRLTIVASESDNLCVFLETHVPKYSGLC